MTWKIAVIRAELRIVHVQNTEHSSHRVHLPGNSAASAGRPPTNLVSSGNAGDQVQTQNDEMPKQSKTLDNSSIWEFCKQFFDLESGKIGLLPLLTPAFQFSRLGTAGGQPCASTTNLQNSSSLVSKYPQSILKVSKFISGASWAHFGSLEACHVFPASSFTSGPSCKVRQGMLKRSMAWRLHWGR